MKINWLVESDVFGEDIPRLVDEIKLQGHNCIVLSYEPFTSYKGNYSKRSHYLNAFPDYEPTIFYGSINFAQQVARESKWIPGVFYNKDAYKCSHFYPFLGKYHLAQEYAFLPWGSILEKKNWIFDTFGNNGCVFMRPDCGEKTFTGKVFTYERFEDEIKTLCYNEPQPNELVVISEPKNISKEWRFIVSDNKVVTGSLYKQDGFTKQKCFDINNHKDSGQQGSLSWLLHNIIKDYQPDPIYCVDICQTKNGYYHLLELGAFTSCGLYRCNLREVVIAASEAAYKEWKEYQCAESSAV